MDGSNSNKRKGAPSDNGVAGPKRKKAGNEGKWKTSHQHTKTSTVQAGTIEPGDAGIWVTCARSMKGKAVRELSMLFEEYAETMYGIKPQEGEQGDEDDRDVAASIEKELASMKENGGGGADQPFSEVRIREECLLFFKSRPPVQPVAIVKRICEDAKSSAVRKTRYINRLTPITLIGKATGAGIEEVSRRVLADCFKLAPSDGGPAPENADYPNSGDEKDKPAYSYAIRLSSRNHSTLKRDDIIKKIASLIDPRHKVNLDSPDKVILTDIYQSICGMSVVDGDWAELKKYNMTELYSRATKNDGEQEQSEPRKQEK
ncbi:Thump domain containing protein [Pleurostoma richardsiae]|uniref:Thump domain containing protein n=1 Tax=Pleurostoma richardsiae TaxID=41990 RepID=A0AA38R5Y6_9PEZI|nr:Thump domain containing protein [Pleurostoma richardsiae]